MRKGLANLFGISLFFSEGFSLIYVLSFLSSYSVKLPTEKNKNSFQKSKTYYQNPQINSQISYYNKTIPRNRDSQISQKGLEIRKDNQRKKISKSLEKKI